MPDLHQQLAGGRWIVADLTGHPGDRPDLHPDPDDLVVAIGEGLRSLHEISVPALLANGDSAQDVQTPGDGWETVVARCREAVEAGLVEATHLPQPYCRYEPADLLDMLVEGRPERDQADEDKADEDKADEDKADADVADEDVGDADVVCHGSATADRFVVDGGRFTGFRGLESALIADRHLDLAVIHQSVQETFGPEAVFRFYEAYGQDPDLARLEHYVLAAHLMPGIWRRS